MLDLSRRELLFGAAASAALGGCGLAGSGPEDDVPLIDAQTTPLHLTATGVVSSGTSAGVNAAALKNPYGLPMEIYEIKWGLRASNFVSGAGIACSLQLGDHQITNGFVPVSGFCKSINMAEAEEARRTSTQGFSEFVFRLAHPILVPAGALLVPQLQWRNAVPGDVTVRVSYAGRTMPRSYRPNRIILPWVTAYISKPMLDSVADSDVSDETVLQNPWPEPLAVSRFVGRVMSVDTTNGITEFFGAASPAMEEGIENLKLKIMRSDGFDVVRDYTRFFNIFDAERRALEMGGAALASNGYYKVDMTKSVPSGGGSSTTQIFTIISMIGYREIGAAR